MTTRFRTHAFFLCFVPFAMLLAGSFWTVQRFVQSTVRDGLHASLRESQAAMAAIHANGDLQNSRSLKLASENSALKAGMQQLLTDRKGEAARRTVEDQLRLTSANKWDSTSCWCRQRTDPRWPEFSASPRAIAAGPARALWIPISSTTAMQISGFWAGAFFMWLLLR